MEEDEDDDEKNASICFQLAFFAFEHSKHTG
jgi:hypothetical protein